MMRLLRWSLRSYLYRPLADDCSDYLTVTFPMTLSSTISLLSSPSFYSTPSHMVTPTYEQASVFEWVDEIMNVSFHSCEFQTQMQQKMYLEKELDLFSYPTISRSLVVTVVQDGIECTLSSIVESGLYSPSLEL
jgi:MAATS-type transcriptional repressor, C-terminal region